MFVFPDAEVLRTDAAFRKNGRCFRQHESRPADCATSKMDKVPIVGVTIDARILTHRRDKHTVAELEVANGERIKRCGMKSTLLPSSLLSQAFGDLHVSES